MASHLAMLNGMTAVRSNHGKTDNQRKEKDEMTEQAKQVLVSEGQMERVEESYLSMRMRVMNDPSSTFWLRKAVAQLEQRDPVDALMDAEYLLKMMTRRMEEEKRRLYEEFVGMLNPNTQERIPEREMQDGSLG